MPLIAYTEWSPRGATWKIVQQANAIIEDYAAQGFSLTLRQLYYQFVARDLIPNKQTEYKRLGDIVSKARRAGMIDWEAIEDRTRNLQSLGAWESPSEIVSTCARNFRYDMWEHQPTYVEVWFEKDALMGVFERVCKSNRVPFFSCRGYTSDSEVWRAAQRLVEKTRNGQQALILHFGDHDPSGLDMTRDIEDRLRLFSDGELDYEYLEIQRLALNMDQIRRYDPPPNPAKEADARFEGYRKLYGSQSWELDALSPTVLAGLVEDALAGIRNEDQWDKDHAREQEARRHLSLISSRWDEVTSFVGGKS